MAASSRYGVSLKQLRELMEHRGREGVNRISEFGGVQEIYLTKKLKTFIINLFRNNAKNISDIKDTSTD